VKDVIIDGVEEGVNVDYKTIMDNKKFDYSEFYEAMMFSKGEVFDISNELQNKLFDKREFGLKKYGDKSFQNSFETSMIAPIKEHAMEELIDELNYLFHLHFVLSTKGTKESNKELIEITLAVSKIKEVYNILNSLSTV